MLVKDFIGAYLGKLDCIVVEVGSKEPLFTTRNRDFLISFAGEYLLVNWDFEIMAVNPALVYFHLDVAKPVEKVETDEEFEERNQKFLESLNDMPDSSKYDTYDIRNLPVDKGVINPLVKAGVKTFGDLKTLSAKELSLIPRISHKRIADIKDALYRYGLYLRQD